MLVLRRTIVIENGNNSQEKKVSLHLAKSALEALRHNMECMFTVVEVKEWYIFTNMQFIVLFKLPPGNGAPFPPQFGGPPGRGPPNQRWDNIGGPMGGGSGKFGVGDLPGPGTGANAQPRGGGPAPAGLFTSGPPPPLHSMGMMPPRHGPGHIIGHMPPPPLLPPLNPHGMGGNIGMVGRETASDLILFFMNRVNLCQTVPCSRLT